MSNLLTLGIDAEAQGYFESLRQQYFPPERNQIPAHISLFHTLPGTGEEEQRIAGVLEEAASAQSRFRVAVTGVRSLGKGVAYTLASGPLLALHRTLAASFADHLSPQDRQRFQPHIVVQNKVTPERARALLHDLERSFHAMEFEACSLELWQYLGGPWLHLQSFPFASARP